MCNEAARRTALGLMREDFSQLKIPLRFPEGLPNLGEAPSIRITDTTVIVRAARRGVAVGHGSGGADGVASPGDDALVAEMVQRRWSWLGGSSSGSGSGGSGSARAGGAAGKPVYNFRSEGRRFDFADDGAADGAADGRATLRRCLIPLDGFYEFTDAGTVVAESDAGGGDRGESGGGDAGARTLTLPLQEQRSPPSPSRGEGKKAKKDKWLFSLSPDAGAAWNPAGRAAPGLFAVAGLWRGGADLGKGMTGEAWTMLTCEPGPDIAPYHKRQIVLIPRDRWADWLGVGAGGLVPSSELIAPTPGGTLVVARA